MIAAFQGNGEILREQKTAFLCSRRYPAAIVLKSYDWAIAMREQKRCVITGNHSQIEKDVFHYLLQGDQPLILVLARGMMKRMEADLEEASSSHRLLIVSPFASSLTRVSRTTACKRNELMAEHADEIFIAYADTGGNIEQIAKRWIVKGKIIRTFDVPENQNLIREGAVAY